LFIGAHLQVENMIMKWIKYLCSLSLLLAATTITTKAQTISLADSTGLPGDNFSLEGALELFKKSASPEEFERLINSEDNKVNNLDLNEDGEIDYIKVIDKNDNGAHAFILQVAVSESENQDIAVIELEKTGDNQAVAQIVGDEDIYGEETILESTDEVVTNAGTSRSRVVVNVWAWPAVRYVYAPSYRVWVSPYRWRVYPTWWRPWRPVRHHVFYGYRAPYRGRYVVVPAHRAVRAHRIYTPARTTSVTVKTRHNASVTNYRATRTTKKTVTVQGKKGNKQVKATRTTKTTKARKKRN
jgi:hypothetical protein